MCSQRKLCNDNTCLIRFEKSFASNPKAQFWHPTKNLDVKPWDIMKSSNKKYWFLCECGHDFERQCDQITRKKPIWCPYCSNPPKRLCEDINCKQCFKKSFASHIKSKCWCYEKNGDAIPRNVFQFSHEKYWFNCNECHHIFEMVLADVSDDGWCQYCANRQLCDDSNCLNCFNKSFASTKLSKWWNTKKNIPLPREVFKWTHTTFSFICPVCYHEFARQLDHTRGGLLQCPYCPTITNRQGKICDDTECSACSNKSFASIDLGKLRLHIYKNENFDSSKISKYSEKKVVFTCQECSHDFESIIANVSHGTSCPFCAKQRLCADSNCSTCFEKSFASSSHSVYWDYTGNGAITPRDIFKSSSLQKYWFICAEKHKFDSTPANISNGHWCVYCSKGRSETLCRKIFEKIYNVPFRTVKPTWNVSDINTRLELDGYNVELQLAFEYMGIQHSEYEKFFHRGDVENFHKQQRYDAITLKNCQNNGILLIVIPHQYDYKNPASLLDFIYEELKRCDRLPENYTYSRQTILEFIEM